MVTQTTDSKKRAKDERTEVKSKGRNFLLYLFFLKLNFPFRNTRNFFTSLGILRVKPEVFHFSGRFLFTSKRPLHFPSWKMIKSIGIIGGAQSGTENWEIEYLSMTSAVDVVPNGIHFLVIHLGGGWNLKKGHSGTCNPKVGCGWNGKKRKRFENSKKVAELLINSIFPLLLNKTY